MKRDQWPGWKTIREIGSGSFGAVYEIEKDTAGFIEKAALKVVSIPESDSDIEDYRLSGYDDESIRKRYLEALGDVVHEYRVMKELKGCPSIVICDDVQPVQHEDGIGWDVLIKMELLTPLMKTLGKEVTDDQVIRIGKDLCAALMECERRGVLHRDIKPQNIFVSENGTYKLGDFGIAKAVEKTTRGTQSGTYRYMAPEVYHNEPYGSKADIYSLGLVLYWLLNERHEPFVPINNRPPTTTEEDTARMRRLTKEMAGKYLPVPKNGSETLKRIVCKSCAYDPNDRYQSAEEMWEALDQMKDLTVGVFTGGKKEKEEPDGLNSVLKKIAIALGIILLGIVIAIAAKIIASHQGEQEAQTTAVPTEETTGISGGTEKQGGDSEDPKVVTGIRFTNYDQAGSPYTVILGTEIAINVELEPVAAEGEVVWSSSDTKIANIDANGRFVAAYPGQVTITATSGDVSCSCAYNVILRDSISHTNLTKAEIAYFCETIDKKVKNADSRTNLTEKEVDGGYYKGFFENDKMIYSELYYPYPVDENQEHFALRTTRIYMDDTTKTICFARVTITEAITGNNTGYEKDFYYYKGMLVRVVENGVIYDNPSDDLDYYEGTYYDQLLSAYQLALTFDYYDY